MFESRRGRHSAYKRRASDTRRNDGTQPAPVDRLFRDDRRAGLLGQPPADRARPCAGLRHDCRHHRRAVPAAHAADRDGWRPRFVEQDLSVDLKWQGKDGKTHEHKKVPVTEGFAGKIVSGDQVRLIPVPVKLLDDELSVPVITADTTARLASLQSWTTISGYIALAAWAGFAGLSVLRWRRGERWASAGTVAADRHSRPRRTLLGPDDALRRRPSWRFMPGRTRVRPMRSPPAASIPRPRSSTWRRSPSDGGRPSYTVRLSWKDAQGAVHHFGPTHISEAFWKKITRDGELAVRQTPMRYRADDPQARPVIVDDAPEQQWQTQYGIVAGLILMMPVPAACFRRPAI